MKENYIGKIADWCKAHNIALTGHLLADTTVMQGTWDSGDTLSVLERIHMPGIDDIITRMGDDVLVAFAHIDAVKRWNLHLSRKPPWHRCLAVSTQAIATK